MEKSTVMARLAAMYPQAKKTTLREMVEKKRVRVRGVAVRSMKQEVEAGDEVEVVDPGAAGVRAGSTLLAEGLKMVHFDSDVVIVEKPAGLLTSTDAEEKRPTAWRILQDYFASQNHKNRIHLIHRLDRDASGLLVFGRSRDAYGSLKEQFFNHTITRQYDVIVHGIPKKPKARLEHLLLEDPRNGMVLVTKDLKNGKPAVLDYELMGSRKDLAHLRCTLQTGRKHQIRVQLKAIGHAVCGDPVYGKGDEPPGRMALHASHLKFVHPGTKREAQFDSPMPVAFGNLVRG